MTIVLFSAMRKREKILDLNEEIVRRNENRRSPNYSNYGSDDENKPYKAISGITDNDPEDDFEFYEEEHGPMGFITK